MSDFSKRLTNLRENRNWSKSYVARQLKLSPQRYSNWEYGTREPDLDNLKKISKLFDVTIDYLLGKSPTIVKEPQSIKVDLDEILDDVRSFDGKPLDNHDRELIRAYLKGLYDQK